uniref:TSA: Wollemia nobilis Ref_Wollemi_Transcript_20563_1431 transcribed RNA sequence n=1 Tax=Wollemia nobilis TaxID=56998 RepID=A0A0C9RR82_9CONI
MPVLGLGLASPDTMVCKGSAPQDHIKAAVFTAIQIGYRAFDTASSYFTESVLGESLKEAFEKGVVARHEVFVTSKLWPTHCYPEDVVPALRKSLETVKLEYLDLYLIHLPIAFKKGTLFPNITSDDVVAMDIRGVWRAMEECVELGLTRAIGVSNFSANKIQDMLAFAKIPPAVNQVEMHPVCQQKKLREYCKSVNVHVSAWSPLGGPGTPWASLTSVLDNPIINQIANKHAKTAAQVALRWGIEQGVSIMCRSYNPARLLQNSQIFDWRLDEEDHEKMSSIPEGRSDVLKTLYVNPVSGYYKTVQELWSEWA